MPNGAQEQSEEGEASGGESEEEWQSEVRGERMTTAPVKRRRRWKSILLARKGDPSSSTTPRASVAK